MPAQLSFLDNIPVEWPDNWESFTTWVMAEPLLLLACLGIGASIVGSVLSRLTPLLGGFVKGMGTLALIAATLLTIGKVAQVNLGETFALSPFDQNRQKVEGHETRVTMRPDGHFWVTATVNGVKRNFLVDTGATLTAISPDTAQEAQLKSNPMQSSITMHTANGTVDAKLAVIDELRLGNIVARNLDAVVAPGLGDANVIGMNVLSRLASWRVEGKTLILTPHNPQDTHVN